MTIEVGGAAGGLPVLAPELTYPGLLTPSTGYREITAINAVGALTTALSLTGKYAIDLLHFDAITNETMTIKLTIDGIVIWDDTFTSGATKLRLFGSKNANGIEIPSSIQCKSSLLLEVQTLTDSDIDLFFVARPIV